MSQKGGFVVVDSDNVVNGEKIAKCSSGSATRRRLADISNLPPRPKPLTHDEKSKLSSNTVKDYADKLQKENTALMKLLAERNKIIELSGAELHRLKVNLQKMQQQNLQLAQANSQMLAELTSGKDRLKAVQHELGCKNSLLAAKMLELRENEMTKTFQKIDIKEKVKCEETGMCKVADKDNVEHCNTSRRQKSKSLGPSTIEQVQHKDKSGEKRLRTRRQSARFRHEELNPTEDVFDIDNVELPLCSLRDDKMEEGDSTSILPVKKEDEEGDSSLGVEALEHGRPSFSRPSRQAAKKIQSYKEIPLNVKMRRTQ